MTTYVDHRWATTSEEAAAAMASSFVNTLGPALGGDGKWHLCVRVPCAMDVPAGVEVADNETSLAAVGAWAEEAQ